MVIYERANKATIIHLENEPLRHRWQSCHDFRNAHKQFENRYAISRRSKNFDVETLTGREKLLLRAVNDR